MWHKCAAHGCDRRRRCCCLRARPPARRTRRAVIATATTTLTTPPPTTTTTQVEVQDLTLSGMTDAMFKAVVQKLERIKGTTKITNCEQLTSLVFPLLATAGNMEFEKCNKVRCVPPARPRTRADPVWPTRAWRPPLMPVCVVVRVARVAQATSMSMPNLEQLGGLTATFDW